MCVCVWALGICPRLGKHRTEGGKGYRRGRRAACRARRSAAIGTGLEQSLQQSIYCGCG